MRMSYQCRSAGLFHLVAALLKCQCVACFSLESCLPGTQKWCLFSSKDGILVFYMVQPAVKLQTWLGFRLPLSVIPREGLVLGNRLAMGMETNYSTLESQWWPNPCPSVPLIFGTGSLKISQPQPENRIGDGQQRREGE